LCIVALSVNILDRVGGHNSQCTVLQFVYHNVRQSGQGDGYSFVYCSVSVTTLDSLDKVAAPWRRSTKESDSDADETGKELAGRPTDESEELPG
jgi:hypothetical protein